MLSDLTAVIKQSVADKFLDTIKYPFTLFDETYPFDPNSPADDHIYKAAHVNKLLKDALGEVESQQSALGAPGKSTFLSDVFRASAQIIEAAKKCLDALTEAEKKGEAFVGPPKAYLQRIVKDGILGLNNIKGIEIRAHLAWLNVTLAGPPTIKLGSPKITVGNVDVQVSATGELWWYHPSFHCSKLCTNWSATWGWDRLASLTVRGIKLKADAHVEESVAGATVTLRGEFDSLRLNYPILDQFHLEGFANNALKDKLVKVFDGSKSLDSIPVVGDRLRVKNIGLPPAQKLIEVDVEVEKI